MNWKKLLSISIIVLIGISIYYFGFVKNTENEPYKRIEENASNIKYIIHDNYHQGTFDYSKRGYYVDTLNQPNAPYYYIITMGEQDTGGFSISIIDVKIDNEKNVEVIVKENKPRPDDMVTLALTRPACCLELSESANSIKIKNTEGQEFEEIKNIKIIK